MAGENLGIDATSWEVTLLPHPKRFARSRALGFCEGHVVGMAETGRARSQACWWPHGRPELLSLEGYKELQVMFGRGDSIAGSWLKGGSRGAAVWRRREDQLVGTSLHDSRFEQTWAGSAAPGLVVGVGVHRGSPGARPPDIGLVWRTDGTRVEITAAADVCLDGTDGTRLVGSVGGRAALWPDATRAHLDLHPAGSTASEVRALDGDTQVGFAFQGVRARAAMWRGSAASFVDLTPVGHEVGRVLGVADGWQVGFVRRTDVTGNGSSSLADQATLWNGANDRSVDLNALLPPDSGLNASVAWSIECRDDRMRICGEATRFHASDPGTDRESHAAAFTQAVVWTARRRSAG